MLKELCAVFSKAVVNGPGRLEGGFGRQGAWPDEVSCLSSSCGCGNLHGRTGRHSAKASAKDKNKKGERGYTEGERKMRCERGERPGVEGRQNLSR